MKKWFFRWLHSEPVWWHFWNPKTGIFGGVVMGLILAIGIMLVAVYA